MIQNLSDTVNLTVQEYADVFSLNKEKYAAEKLMDWTRVENKLHNEMEWTRDGAVQVAALARDYGVFVLRNALALAFSLGIEDGELGY